MSDIFISYKREDQSKARKLADALEREGWSVWWDPKLRAGDEFDKIIEATLKESRCVIVLWSEKSLTSDYVRAEASEAMEQKKLVPVAIENVNLPFRFKRLHTPKLLDWDGSSDSPEFRKLVQDITAKIGEPLGRTIQPQTATEQLRAAPLAQLAFQRGNLEPGTIFRDTFKDGTRGPEMVVVPAGKFEMGDIHRMRSDSENPVHDFRSDSENPVHDVHIHKSFAVGRYEVTFEEYHYYTRATRRRSPNDEGWGTATRPVINISWNEAVEYTRWLSEQTGKRYRLPTEAEWEYAARSGGKDEIWSGTSDEKQLAEYAVFRQSQTEPFGSRNPNGLGLYDMSGNVWEWVEDCWHENYTGAPTDGSAWLEADGGDCGRRVIRGGSWNYEPEFLRASSRNWKYAFTRGKNIGRGNNIGFRLAQDLE